MRARASKAFTLVEILIVVVILGILAAIVVPQFTSATKDSQGANIKSQLSNINTQLELFISKNNSAIPTLAEMQTDGAAYAGVATKKHWKPLLDGTPLDGDTKYLKSPPVNPVSTAPTVATLIAAGTVTGADKQVNGDETAEGWNYDDTTGLVAAAGYNEETGKVGTGL